jgi:PTH1 family peptidyl-tRNA hydrolase
MSIKLIVGLCNPGSNYAATRHNAGGWFVEALAQQYQTTFKIDKKLRSELTHIEVSQVQCKMMMPLDFMNLNGLAVRAVSQFYRVEPQEILVAHDDLDLAPGRIKLKSGGGHGGHNGLRDVIQQLGTSDFYRLRIGIGHPGHKDLVSDYVLSKPSQQDSDLMEEAILRAVKVTPIILSDSIMVAMSQLNN